MTIFGGRVAKPLISSLMPVPPLLRSNIGRMTFLSSPATHMEMNPGSRKSHITQNSHGTETECEVYTWNTNETDFKTRRIETSLTRSRSTSHRWGVGGRDSRTEGCQMVNHKTTGHPSIYRYKHMVDFCVTDKLGSLTVSPHE